MTEGGAPLHPLEPYLSEVRKPARYIGREYNSVEKSWQPGMLSCALCFPDSYEIGMSHLGLKILYDILNRRPDVVCERCFAPWPDMEELLRRQGVPLTSLETFRPLSAFDIVGFSLQYELSYTNVLAMLELGGVPLEAADRSGLPVVIAGGPCTVNPEPLSPFIDAFVVGEAEECIVEIVDLLQGALRQGAARTPAARRQALQSLSELEGVYVPAIHLPRQQPDRRPEISRRIVRDFEHAPAPTAPVVPFVEAVQDRIAVEIMRGCPNRCYFCQAGFSISPVRVRSVERICEIAQRSYQSTGYDSLAFCSLSSVNYPHLKELLNRVYPFCKERNISIALPSLRVSSQLQGIAATLAELKKTGLTFAPEAGSERLRILLNKRIDIDQLRQAVLEAYQAGWRRLKLYFMIGLPTETETDLQAIVALVTELAGLRRRIDKRRATISVSIANYIPKPHTPFQWLGMDTRQSLTRKQQWLKQRLPRTVADVDTHSVDMSYVEAYLCRADRQAATVIRNAFAAGARFDGWSSEFVFSRWQQAWQQAGINPDPVVTDLLPLTGPLAWEHICCGISHQTLARLFQRTGLSQPAAGASAEH